MSGSLTDVEIVVDGAAVRVPEGTILIDACEKAGVDFVRPKADLLLKSDVYGDVYLVEANGECVRACDVSVKEGMVVSTRSARLDKARFETVEKLMRIHAPECMTCEKAGDCFLQKLRARYYKKDTSGFPARKSEPAFDLNAFVAHHPSRCVGCGRCVAYLTEFAGSSELALEDGRIKLLNPKGLTCEFSGNLTDVCPFGAMTSKIEKQGLRPWNLTVAQSIDLSDTVAADVRAAAANGVIARVMPASNGDAGDMWLSDRARYSFDALAINRIDKPYVRKNGVLTACSWKEAARAVAEKLNKTAPEKAIAFAGGYADCESMMALQDWFESLGMTACDVYGRAFYAEPEAKASWLFNTHLDGVAQADALLMVGVDVRSAAPTLNARLRQNPMPKALIGVPVGLTYPYTYLGNSPEILNDVAQGKSAFRRVLEQAKRPMIIVGRDALARADGGAVSGVCRRIADECKMVREDWNGFNFLADFPAETGALALNFINGEPLTPRLDEFDFVYALGAQIPPEKTQGKFVVYQGIFACDTACAADVVLPSLSGFEKSATFVNLEGRARRTTPVLPPLNLAREDWKIIRFLSEYTNGAVLPYDDSDDVRDHLAGRSVIFYNQGEKCYADWVDFGTNEPLENAPFALNGGFDAPYSKTMTDAFKARGGVE